MGLGTSVIKSDIARPDPEDLTDSRRCMKRV
jgi:hypothetical protein